VEDPVTSPNVSQPRQPPEGLPPLPPLPRLAAPACAGRPVFAEDPTSPAVLADCRAACAGCPDTQPCLDTALRTHPLYDRGIRAGTTRIQRRTLRAEAGIAFAALTGGDVLAATTGTTALRSKVA
jgi:hypothetical protein